MFFKEVENFYICAPHNREGFDKLKIKMDSEKECQLKKIRKIPVLISRKESLTKQVKKYLNLFNKNKKTIKKGTSCKIHMKP